MTNRIKRITALVLAMTMCILLLHSAAMAEEASMGDTSASATACIETGAETNSDEKFDSEESEASSASAQTEEDADLPEMQNTDADEVGLETDTQTLEPEYEVSGTEPAPEQKAASSELSVQSESSGTCGKNIKWTFQDGVLTFSGTGKMTNYGIYSGEHSPWYMDNSVRKIIIEDGITKVGNCLFYGCGQVTTVVLPKTLKTIGERAFLGCSHLKDIEMPDGTKTIQERAFSLCTSLRNIRIPDSVTTVGASAFEKCLLLFRVEMPEQLKNSIEDNDGLDYVFYDTPWDRLGHKNIEPKEDRFSGKTAELTTRSYPYDTDSVIVGHARTDGGHNIPYCTLIPGDNGEIIRIEFDEGDLYEPRNYNGQSMLIAEGYDDKGQFLWQRQIPVELGGYYGFYVGTDSYFIVFAEERYLNKYEEVYRVVRYDKQWNRIGAASLYGANTSDPHPSLSMVQADDMLYIRTAHVMTDRDASGHQANMSFAVYIPTMTITDVHHYGFVSTGYVSHSLDQYVIQDSEKILSLDLSDGYPSRGIVLNQWPGKAGDMFFNGNPKELNLLNSPGTNSGKIGDTATGIVIGGFEYSETSYIVAGLSSEQTSSSPLNDFGCKNVFIATIDKDTLSSDRVRVQHLTNYATYGIWQASDPYLLKINDNSFILIWNEENLENDEWNEINTLHYVFIDGNGNLTSKIYKANAFLSSCKPCLIDGKVTWYCTNFSGPFFYQIDPKNPEKVSLLGNKKEIGYTYSVSKGKAALVSASPLMLPEKLTIPSKLGGATVTEIMPKAFLGNGTYGILTNVTIPGSIKTIGKSAFEETSLQSATIKNGVTTIGKNAFKNCEDLKTVKLPDSVTVIGENAFAGCKRLNKSLRTSLSIPKKVTVKKGKGAQYTVSWKNGNGTDACQVQYSTKQDFGGGSKTITVKKKSSTSIKGMSKGKTYYIRVRACRTILKKKRYSEWSEVKSVKVK